MKMVFRKLTSIKSLSYLYNNNSLISYINTIGKHLAKVINLNPYKKKKKHAPQRVVKLRLKMKYSLAKYINAKEII